MVRSGTREEGAAKSYKIYDFYSRRLKKREKYYKAMHRVKSASIRCCA